MGPPAPPVGVSRPLEAVRGRFAGDGRWLAVSASAVERERDTLRLRIGPSWAAGRMTSALAHVCH